MEYLRKHITDGQIVQALEELVKIANRHNYAEKNDLNLLLSQYNILKRESNLGLGEHSGEIARIALSTLEYIDKMEAAFGELVKTEDTAQDAGARMLEQLKQLTGKVDLLLNIMGQWRNPLFENFRRSRLWNLLDGRSRNHLMAAVALENNEALDDFGPVATEYGKALENELLIKLFQPYRDMFLAQYPKMDRNQYMQQTYGNFKQVLFAFLYKNEKLTLNQMVGMLYEGLSTLKDQPDKLFSPRAYFYQFFRLKNVPAFINALDHLQDVKLLRSARNFIYTRQEIDEFKDWIFDVLANMQPNLVTKGDEG